MSEKKYKKGYMMGVFDLFHVGHLNLIERAKERCDELVVGVLSDDLVFEQKGSYPVIGLEDRMRIIAALEAVDEAVAVTDGRLSKIEERKRIGFDCFFSGNDYEGNEMWEFEKKELEKEGATIEFFPYTEEISTTKIKEKIKG